MSHDLNNQLVAICQTKKINNLWRERNANTQNSPKLCFSGNDYLSLGNLPELTHAYIDGFEKYGVGSTGSMYVSGYHLTHEALEQDFCDALGTEKSVICSSGYVANLAITNLLALLQLEVLIDKACHASIYDGLKQADLSYMRFCHNDPQDALKRASHSTRPVVAITEAIFSMSGQFADLNALSKAASALIVDEAHSFGIVGDDGMGLVKHVGNQKTPLRAISFGKSMAGQGAVITGDADWINALTQVARPLIYSTAISPALAYGLRKALAIVQQSQSRRTHLWHLVDYFVNKAAKSVLPWRKSTTPIQQLRLGCAKQALHCASWLEKYGIHCVAMRPPTVSFKDSGLRIVLNYDHSFENIDKLFSCLDMWWYEYQIAKAG